MTSCRGLAEKVRLIPDGAPDAASGVPQSPGERQYLLSLLGIAEELLALMPSPVQHKYGLIKGTLAVKLGSSVGDLPHDSAILASLTSGIQPHVATSTPDRDSLDASAVAHALGTPPVPGAGAHDKKLTPASEASKAAVVRSLDGQMTSADEKENERDWSPGTSSRQNSGPFSGARGTRGMYRGIQHVRLAQGEDEMLKSMLRHHLRALRASISQVQAASCDASRDREVEGKGEEMVDVGSTMETLMACSEALGTLQALYQRHMQDSDASSTNASSGSCMATTSLSRATSGCFHGGNASKAESTGGGNSGLSRGWEVPVPAMHGDVIQQTAEEEGSCRSQAKAELDEVGGDRRLGLEAQVTALQKEVEQLHSERQVFQAQTAAAAQEMLQAERAILQAETPAQDSPMHREIQAAFAELVEKRAELDLELQNAQHQKDELEHEAGRKLRGVMREMEAQHRSALQQQKLELELAHAKAVALGQAELQQALAVATERATHAEERVRWLQIQLKTLEESSGFDARGKARDLEAENRKLRRTMASLSKATTAERQTYQTLYRDLESYQKALCSIAQDSDRSTQGRLQSIKHLPPFDLSPGLQAEDNFDPLLYSSSPNSDTSAQASQEEGNSSASSERQGSGGARSVHSMRGDLEGSEVKLSRLSDVLARLRAPPRKQAPKSRVQRQ